jgi:hypothetical protein
MRAYLMSLTIFALVIALLLLYATAVGASDAHWIAKPVASSTQEAPAPHWIDANACTTLAEQLANRQDVVEIDEFDYLLHSAGCDQNETTGMWEPERSGSCMRRAYWLFVRGYSLLRIDELLTRRNCVHFEDGTYGHG